METRAIRRKAMPRRTLAQIFAALAILLLTAPPVLADQAADDLIREMEDRTRAETNIATYRMQVVRAGDDDREFLMQSWDDRVGGRSFIHILEPRRDADTTFLKVEGNLWMYLPRLERDIKIPPAMMLNSWMGSDFTNDDLVRESSAIEDYTNTILAREPGPDGTELITIESVPHPDAPVVWGKVVLQIRSDGIPVRQQFFDEDGVLVRTMVFEDVAEMDGRLLPTRMTMLPADKPGDSTVLIIEQALFDQPIAAEVFTRANLSRRR